MVQVGKQINALDFDIEETERKLNRLKQDRNELERGIFAKISFYHGLGSYSVILEAKEKADQYNNERLMNSKPQP